MKYRAAVSAAIGALAGTALLTLAVPTSAYAANGTFTYQTRGGVEKHLFNPRDNVCLNIDVGGPVKNATDSQAFLFSRMGCQGPIIVVDSGESEPFLAAASVMFFPA